MTESTEFLEFSTRKDWALTCTIPAFKKVKFNGKNKKYNTYTLEEQQHILKKAIMDAYKFLGHTSDLNIKFEQHDDKRAHAHLTIYHISEMDMQTMGSKYLQSLGLKNNLSDFYYIEKFNERWENYIRKTEIDDLDADLLLLEKEQAKKFNDDELELYFKEQKEKYSHLFVNF